jgi:KamA family protein
MAMRSRIQPRRYTAYTRKDIDRIPALRSLSEAERTAMKAVSAIFPFRVNNYVVEDLIDWSRVPDDPMFQLTFPQEEMLDRGDFLRMVDLIESGSSEEVIQGVAREIQYRQNPHPADQMDLNIPILDGEPLPGMQHKYRETVLFFPSQGQTCHAYCTYCFRWPQFVGIDELKFASREAEKLERYLRVHPEVHSVLFTGGDPMIMRTQVLRRYIEPLLQVESLTSIRIGTKATAYWPYRFLTDKDADEALRLFEEIRASGKHLALMSHYSHPVELETEASREAVRRIRAAGAVVRCQAPLIRHVNDSKEIWGELWRRQVQAGAIPYYMFVERDTGPKKYFEVPLARALRIFQGALKRVSGLARTVRGPSMSATPGKVLVQGTAEVWGEKVFVLSLLQARDPDWTGRQFFARYDESATWLDDLKPAFDEEMFFFEPGLERMRREAARSKEAPEFAGRLAALAHIDDWE